MSDLLWLLVHLKRQPNGHLEVWKTRWMPRWHARIADSRIRNVNANKFTAEAYKQSRRREHDCHRSVDR